MAMQMSLLQTRAPLASFRAQRPATRVQRARAIVRAEVSFSLRNIACFSIVAPGCNAEQILRYLSHAGTPVLRVCHVASAT